MSQVHPLKGDQARAVDPSDSVWLSASAGTGKTQVLSARVLRLLLTPGVRPENILCLTFTKAGAAEMAERVSSVLARWVRLERTRLFAELEHIGADPTSEVIERARTLFASVLDCPGGGLRIDTIHAFAQWLLGAFPEEAGLIPGTRAMEDRDRELLAHQVLADLLIEWESRRETDLIAALEGLSLRFGPDKARSWLMRCAEAREAWFGPGSWQEPLRHRVEALLGLESGTGPVNVAALCEDAMFDTISLRRCLTTLEAWDSQTGRDGAGVVRAWLALDPAGRAETIETFYGTVLNKTDGQPKQLNNILKRDPGYGDAIAQVMQCLERVQRQKALLSLADLLTPALTVGRRFALAWEEAKQREGLVDFDDLIRRAAGLLKSESQGRWIAYKLDRQFDHILVDEAQDTNEAQWEIIRALTGEFFTGEGQRDNKLRTIFVVGDYKQAIFGFQGTSPENFEAAKNAYAREMAELARNTAELRQPIEARELVELGLGRSFRTSQPVLDFVDMAIEAIGPENFGLKDLPERHVGHARPGLVTLWNPVNSRPDDEDDGEGPETWLSAPERRMADKIADQIKSMIGRFTLAKEGGRTAAPGDFMVLVRKRRELAGLIVARLHAAGVPVAGVDRLRLGAPLAVKDLMAALRFAAQPRDDLSLAALLVSPLVGWSQEQLLEHGYRSPKVPLWDHLRRSRHAEVAALRDLLDPLLARADFEPPQALLQWLLVGPWQGRRKLVARLSREANDPINELLNAALAYSSSNTPSLQGFIQWFDAGEGELKREAGGAENLVRVMTVHGSKGLQAPIVILADATGDPDRSQQRGLSLKEPPGERTIPILDLGKDLRVGRVAEAAEVTKKAEREEHWRLLYVAMTRAEEALFIGGALGKREKEPAADSWYARLDLLVQSDRVADPIWGELRELGERAPAALKPVQEELAIPLAPPAWALRTVGPEPRPPRPLAPSSVGEDQGADPPLPAEALATAAQRGVLIHRLLERLPDIAPDERELLAVSWLARNAATLSEDERTGMVSRALTVLAEPKWAELFSPDTLAEVPLAAVVEGQVISGTVDRLLVQPDRVLVADFKTARRPPRSIEEVPLSTLRQMAAYAAALAAIYPGRRIEAAILYTQTPQLIPIPADLLAAHRPGLNAGLTPEQESFVN
ncbi:double-strand break repair helicase AddA [Croceibacterium sp. LX-88]|uniref:DNA 3'-5' helicase n=1 Tax=Croceibacterium selenioxidans TaxID=2838833 RepID=A0ABS5W2R0_9SPHN|nr:double-strand break repair helicase AddA [Croceibacterium selenioxidans]MBT2133979.1 double-strand break repair helicase AddA [Croceibacterium selenioxidans]